MLPGQDSETISGNTAIFRTTILCHHRRETDLCGSLLINNIMASFKVLTILVMRSSIFREMMGYTTLYSRDKKS